MRNPIVFFIALLFTFSAFAQKVTATAEKQKILLGEQFVLHLQANLETDEPFAWPEIDTIPHFEILQRSSVDTHRIGDALALSQRLLITSFDSGRWQIPAFEIAERSTEPITIDVVFSSPFDPAQPYHDIKDIIEVKHPIHSTWHWYVILALVLLALFLLFFPKGKKKAVSPFVPDEGAYKEALKKLGQLKEKQNIEPGVFYTEMVHIFREYLHKRKNIQSHSKTTDDLAIQLAGIHLQTDQEKKLLQVLRLSDMVKYARFRPLEQENIMSIETIQESIINIENAV